jgi:hypothetical protein
MNKFKIGELVEGHIMGKIREITRVYDGKIKYNITDDKGNNAFLYESEVFPMVTPEELEKQK